MRQVLSIFFVLYLFVISWLPNIIFKYQQSIVRKEIKKQIKNGVPENQRVTFYLDELESDKTNRKWMHQNEFKYKGEMYDVLKRDTCNGRLILICLHDVKESGLFSKLDESVKKEMGNNKPFNNNKKLLSSFFNSLYNQKNNNHKFLFFIQKHVFSNYIENYNSIDTEPIIPPPKYHS